MITDRVLADYDAQVRRANRPDQPGTVIEATGGVVRQVAPRGQGQSWVTWSRLDEHTAGAAIAAQVGYFRGRNQSFEWKLYDYDQPADLGDRLAAAGLAAGEDEMLMVAGAAQQAAGPAPLPDGVSVAELAGQDGLEQLLGVHDRVFSSGQAQLREALAARLAQAPESFAMVVAQDETGPVSAARVEFPPGTDFAALYGGGTVSGWRGRGLYRALVVRRAQLAARRGYRYLQVDALPTSAPILARLGFAALARTTPYVWDPGSAPGTLPA